MILQALPQTAPMFWVAAMVCAVAVASTQGRAELLLENLVLRQQLAVLRRGVDRPRLRLLDRLFWVALSRLWPRWREALHLVTPATVIAWQRAGFRFFWAGAREAEVAPPSRLRGRRSCAGSHPSWGAPRIHGDLLKLGFCVAQSTVAAWMPSTTDSRLARRLRDAQRLPRRDRDALLRTLDAFLERAPA